MHVSKRLLQWRLDRGLSQRSAAKSAGITQPAWQKYEDGKARPGLRSAHSIERITGGAILASEWAETDEEVALRRARTRAHTPARVKRNTEAKSA